MNRVVAWGAVLLSGCAHGSPSASLTVLDDLLAFTNPALCEPAVAHAKLLDMMVGGDANQGFRSGRIEAPPRLARAFGPIRTAKHPGYTTIAASVRGSLFGLPLVEVVQSLPEGGDPGEVSYAFAASAETVERAANRAGIPARAGQTISVGPPDGYEHYVELKPDLARPGHSLMSCGFQ